MRKLIFILLAIIGVSQAQTIQYIGAPTTTVISRGNFRTDSIFYLPKRSKAPTDTAAFRYQISDSSLYVWTGSQWIKAGGSGMITGSGVAGYMPEFTTTTNLDTTRLYHSAGRFAIGSTTTTNGVFNVYGGQSYFDTSLKVGSQTLLADEANERVGVGLTSMTEKFEVAGNAILGRGNNASYFLEIGTGRTNNGEAYIDLIGDATNTNFGLRLIRNNAGVNASSSLAHRGTGALNLFNFNAAPIVFIVDSAIAATINPTGELLLNNAGSDSGAYKLQITGNVYTTGTAVFGAVSGDVGIGTKSPVHKLHLNSSFTTYAHFTNTNSGTTNADGMSIGIDGNDYYIWVRENQPLYIGTNSTSRLLIKADGELLVNTTTDAGDYKLQVSGNIYNTGSITTGAPSGGSIKPWKIGEAATVSPTSPNRTIRVEIDGVVYYLHAKTTND